MWFDVASRMDAQKDMCLRECGLRVQILKAILGSIVNMIMGTCMTI